MGVLDATDRSTVLPQRAEQPSRAYLDLAVAGATGLEQELLSVAAEAALVAAAELVERFGREPGGLESKSTPTDLVSAADLAAEEAIRRVLAEQRPDDAILGEEGGASAGSTGDALRWVVDPLDGTVNYLHGIPQFGVSVACEDADGAIVGVVLNPISGETFAATRSGLPTLDGVTITGSDCDSLSMAIVGTGFGYEPEVRVQQGAVLVRLLPVVADVRRQGAAALDLCACAAGRIDGYYERGVKAWDVAAGALICARAGLQFRRLKPSGILPDGVLVAAPGLVDELYALVT
jgi:myo-inositol-1(or 4)-monophosphatase